MTFKLISFLSILVLFSSVTGQKCRKAPTFFSAEDSEGEEEGEVEGEVKGELKGQAYASLSSCECGTSGYRNIWRTQRIIGGREVQPSYKYPWMVSVQKEYIHTCGGSIVSPTFVLTAGHCFFTERIRKSLDRNQTMCLADKGKSVKCFADASMYTIGLRGKRSSSIEQSIPILEYKLHPEFKVDSMTNDIALIRLKRPIPCSPYFRPICLPNNVPLPGPGTSVIVSGWGRTESGRGSKTLLEGSLQIQPSRQCLNINPGTETHFCAAGQAQGTCLGDSGGPSFRAVNKRFYIFGLTSFGKDMTCNPRDPQFYTNVKLYTDWIDDTIRR